MSSMANKQTTDSQSLFFRFPAELRLQVYEDIVYTNPHPAWRVADKSADTLQFLLVCRQIYHEAHILAFQNTTFHFKSPWPGWNRVNPPGRNRPFDYVSVDVFRRQTVFKRLPQLRPHTASLLRHISCFVPRDFQDFEFCHTIFHNIYQPFINSPPLSITEFTFLSRTPAHYETMIRSWIYLISHAPNLQSIEYIEDTQFAPEGRLGIPHDPYFNNLKGLKRLRAQMPFMLGEKARITRYIRFGSASYFETALGAHCVDLDGRGIYWKIKIPKPFVADQNQRDDGVYNASRFETISESGVENPSPANLSTKDSWKELTITVMSRQQAQEQM